MKFIKSISWLAAQLEEKTKRLTLFDCRYDLLDEDSGELAYREGHIPGAYYASLSLHLSSSALPNGVGGRHPLPDPNEFALFLSERGVTSNQTVVAYDDQGGAMASRLRFLLKWVGHTGDVYIIEEGFKGWVAAGYTVEQHIPALKSGEQYIVKLKDDMVVDHHYVSERIGQDDVILIDSRDGARYRGEVEPIDKKAGHIPTAINYVWTENKNSDGSWKQADELKLRFEALDQNKEVIVYCGSGVTATPNLFALQAAGFKNVKLYAGSWSEWSSLPNKQIETSVK